MTRPAPKPATELERMTAERDALAREVEHLKRVWGRAVARSVKEANGRKAALKEIERLTAECAGAFQRGVDAMREAAARRCEVSPVHGERTTTGWVYANAVRTVPDPEDK